MTLLIGTNNVTNMTVMGTASQKAATKVAQGNTAHTL